MAAFVPKGTFTALVTPFLQDASAPDWAALERHVAAQLEAGIDGLVPCGTTGESPTLSFSEALEMTRRVVALCQGRARVIVGTGSYDTKKSLEMSKAVAEAGADAVMLVVPYYSKPSQEGLFRHFKVVADAVSVPVVLYNIPGRTVAKLEVDTAARLAEACSNIVAVKDATNNVSWCQRLRCTVGDRLSVLSGDDALAVPLISVGAQGVISVTSNVLPGAVAAVIRAALGGDFTTATAEHLRLWPVHQAMFCAPNPVPAKVALESKGLMHATVRLPHAPASEEERARVLSALESYEAS